MNEENFKNLRIDYLDEVCGLLIIYMILTHIQICADVFVEPQEMCVLSFFMPWFFFKSGMFYKGKTFRSTLSGWKKLIIPYVVYSFIGHIIYCTRIYLEGDQNWIHYVLSPIKQILMCGSLLGNTPLWFLLSLFMVQLIYSVIHNKIKDELIFMMGALVAFIIYFIDVNITLLFSNTSLGLAFYAIGHKLKERQYFWHIMIVSLIIYFCVFIVYPSAIDFHANKVICGQYILAILFSLSGCILCNNIFKRLPIRISILSYIGKNSMVFYVQHWLILKICGMFLLYMGVYENTKIFTAMVITCIVILPVMAYISQKPTLKWTLGTDINKK